MYMIDGIAEEPHCGELGQGVALLCCLLSPFFHYMHFQSLLIDIYWPTVIYQGFFLCFGRSLFSSSGSLPLAIEVT